MHIQINFSSGLPVYLQIVDQIKAAVASGALKPGEALPSTRPLAEHLQVNRNTIGKAYSELENQGIIESHPGKGSFISGNHSPLKKEIRSKLLLEYIDAAIVQAHHYQIDPQDFLQMVQKRLETFKPKGAS